MLCSTKNVFCDEDADFPHGSPLLIKEEDILIGLGSWYDSCSSPLVKGQYPVAVYTDVTEMKAWIQSIVYDNEGPGTGICCRGKFD